MRTFVLLALAALHGSGQVTLAQNASEYEYGGYETPTLKPTKFPTAKPTKKPTNFPTAKPTAATPTPSPTQAFSTDLFCSTSGGYAVNGTACLDTWTYQKTKTSKKITMKGCVPVSKDVKPFVDSGASGSANSGSFCATTATYVANGPTQKGWGYCKCDNLGCTAASVSRLLLQTDTIVKSLPPAGFEKFKFMVSPASATWYNLLPVNYAAQEQCETDGGAAPRESPCLGSFAYVGKKGVQTQLSGCVSITDFPPSMKGAGNVRFTNTDKTKWCATSAVYDPNGKSKADWGYCNCIPTEVIAGVNSALASYNALTTTDRRTLLFRY